MRATVVSPGLHLRAQPNASAKIKCSLNHDEMVLLMGAPNKWGWQMVKVERTGDYGYVDGHYLKIFVDTEAFTKPPETTPTVQYTPPLITNPVDDGGSHIDIGTVIVALIILAIFFSGIYSVMK
jgi:hypothetical protein